jgi:prephenate dehydrogenase
MSRTLGIVGVGLIGGSVGMAARAAGWEVAGVDAPEVLEQAIQLGAVNRAATIAEVRGADLVVLAAPISRIIAILDDLAPTDALVTDVGSTKAAIVRCAHDRGIRRFVGGHPMAGSQLAGVAHASPGLFRDARYLLTPTSATLPAAYAEITQFVRQDLGAIPTAVDPEKHDLLIAALSHLPHLLAVALLRVTSEISPEALSFAGPSFRDLTRVGAANPSLWSDILAENETAVREVLESFTTAMTRLEDEIGDRVRIAERFTQAGQAYEALGGILIEKSGRNVDIAVPVENRPGVLAEVTTLMGANDINILDLYMQHSDTHRAALVLTIDAELVDRARTLLGGAGFDVDLLTGE